ncbi:hypothetical protein [Rhodoblastus sp.]|uniref:hypothetical protein n=1 Tax=Rhodoblastus sp. TaxID=1962975 RepID=UPI0025D228E6|nr:hypothetical protein [Rhodoblastus sp.]
MSRSFLALFAVLTFVLASEARAARFSLPDDCGHPTRSDHVQGCENTRWACSQQFGPSSKGPPHGLTHCRISYDQCMSLGANGPVSR